MSGEGESRPNPEMESPPRLLPEVRPEVGASVKQEHQENGSQFWRDIGSRLEEENPYLLGLIEGFAKKAKDEKEVEAIAALVYRMLESQAQADEMNKMFEGKANGSASEN